MTKVFAVNGSARMEKGYTATILGAFIEGMEEAGASVELVYPRKYKIRPCLGDFQCWFEKVGECFQADDMQMLIEKMKEADILVLATPVYAPLPGAFQNFLNRLMPIVEPILEFRDGRTRSRFHEDVKISKIALVATGGWWEVDNLGIVLRIVEEMAENGTVEFAGAILRPHAFLMDEYKEKKQKILETVKKVGRQLIKEGKMAEEDLAFISGALVAEEELRERYNRSYRKAKDASK
ncbi:MAG: flavodoxin family protein [Candidatus Thorarchaeota archaeon]|nr:flavodoxin family protein [Candidatus Thorarchaeota archaeon]